MGYHPKKQTDGIFHNTKLHTNPAFKARFVELGDFVLRGDYVRFLKIQDSVATCQEMIQTPLFMGLS